jgi:hypothetical protein
MRVSLGSELTNSYVMAGKFIFGLTSFTELWLHFNAVAELRGRVDGNSDPSWGDLRSQSVSRSLVSWPTYRAFPALRAYSDRTVRRRRVFPWLIFHDHPIRHHPSWSSRKRLNYPRNRQAFV